MVSNGNGNGSQSPDFNPIDPLGILNYLTNLFSFPTLAEEQGWDLPWRERLPGEYETALSETKNQAIAYLTHRWGDLRQFNRSFVFSTFEDMRQNIRNMQQGTSGPYWDFYQDLINFIDQIQQGLESCEEDFMKTMNRMLNRDYPHEV